MQLCLLHKSCYQLKLKHIRNVLNKKYFLSSRQFIRILLILHLIKKNLYLRRWGYVFRILVDNKT